MPKEKSIAVYATDLHGDILAYEKMFEAGSGKNVSAVIVGGDITPFLTAVGDIAFYQREFLQHYLLPRLNAFFEESKKPVFLIPGNDDFKVNVDLLQSAEKKGWLRLITEKCEPVDGFHIAGYPFVNETPFLIKDWERNEERIQRDLKKLASMSDPKKTIYVMHAPPADTGLDVTYSGDHVGSTAVKKFIHKVGPYLTLHGHIHESPQMSGVWKELIGSTVAVNPGSRSILVFDMKNLKEMHII